MASIEATSSDSRVPTLQNTLDEIEKQLESRYRLSTIHQGEAVYLVQRETGDGFRIHFSNETSINLDKDAFGRDLTAQINRLFDEISEPRVLKIREKFSTRSRNETNRGFVSSNEFRDFAKRIDEYQRTLLKEVKAIGDLVQRSIESSSIETVNSFGANTDKVVRQLSLNAQRQRQSNSPNRQSIRQYPNSPSQSENPSTCRSLSAKGFGGEAPADKSACKPALLADAMLRESIAEQREQWRRRRADAQESGLGGDDWGEPSVDRNCPPRVVPLQKGFRPCSRRNLADPTNPLAVRDRCAKCGLAGRWSNDCESQASHCYKPLYHLATGRSSTATRRDESQRLAGDGGNSAGKRSRASETIGDSGEYGPPPRGTDDCQSRGYTHGEPEVTRCTEEHTERHDPDRYAEYRQQYNHPSAQYARGYSDAWNR